jgi:hypothetical protein
MKISNVIGFLLLSVLIGSCVDDADLHKTIFIRDVSNPDLPMYSEWGYNTFGAYINDEVFVSGDILWDPGRISSSETSMILSFHGEKRSKEKDTTDMTLTFSFPRNSPVNGQYLLALNNTWIELDDPLVHVSIISDAIDYPVAIQSGFINFRRVQNLVVDNQPKEIILSGEFAFEGTMNGNPVSVRNGRFDIGVPNYY